MLKTTKVYVLTFWLLLLGIIWTNNVAYTKSDGASANKCGLYGTQSTCAQCHSYSGTNNATNTLSFAGNPTNYVLGQTYTVTVTATAGTRYGFQMAAVVASSGVNAGTFTAGTGSKIVNGTVSGNSIAFIEQNAASSTGSWTFSWKAPTTDVGTVTFYLATNSTNDNGGTSGDKVKTRVASINGPTCNLAAPANPATSNISSTGATFTWAAVSGASSYTLLGRKVGATNWTTVGPISGTSKTVNSLLACTSYEWKVAANCSSGTAGTYSNTVSFTTIGCGSSGKTAIETTNFSIAPNPATNFVNIAYQGTDKATVNWQIVDLTGKIMKSGNVGVVENSQHINIDISDLANAYYMVVLNDGENNIAQKLLIAR